ncbi:MAG: hypothetical protein JXR32_10775, partial [Anaerolineaceae bacterium]|nr:hypothetical protein [Anaerolineaceae bacterium]
MVDRQVKQWHEPCPGIKIIKTSGEEELASLIAETCAASIQTAKDLWGLPPPGDCHIHVMTSWQKFVFTAAPWYLRPVLVTSYPFWAARV